MEIIYYLVGGPREYMFTDLELARKTLRAYCNFLRKGDFYIFDVTDSSFSFRCYEESKYTNHVSIVAKFPIQTCVPEELAKFATD